jgi:hypothetical protein
VRRIALAAIVCALLFGESVKAGRPQTSPGPPAVDPALLTAALAAATEDDRHALVRSRADLRDEGVRRALNAAIVKRGISGDASAAINAYRVVQLAAAQAGDVLRGARRRRRERALTQS